MIEKKIDLFADDFIQINLNNTQLTCELGNNYAILLVSDISDRKIIAYEYFEFDVVNNTWNDIFSEIKISSKILLANHYNTSRLFYNFPETLVAPSLYDNEDNAKVYLNTFYSSVKTGIIQSDKLPLFDNVSIIYSVEEDIMQAVQSNFNFTEVHHSYSKLLQNISQAQLGGSQQCLHVFFYKQMFVLILTDGFQLKFIKSVNYYSVDDMLYFILNAAKQYSVNTEQLQLKVSGLINYSSEEFIVLQKYFSHIVVEELPATGLLNRLFEKFPKQYFTPFFYLPA